MDERTRTNETHNLEKDFNQLCNEELESIVKDKSYIEKEFKRPNKIGVGTILYLVGVVTGSEISKAFGYEITQPIEDALLIGGSWF